MPTPKVGSIPALKTGPLTQSFFARGEEQEATGYQNLAIDDPVLAPPEIEFDSFDKIPRKRSSWFALGISVLVLSAVGFVTWRSFHFLSRPGSSVTASSRAMVQAPPAPAAQPAPAMAVAPAAPPISSPPAAPSNATATPAPSEENVAPEPSAAAPHAVAPVVVPLPPRHEPARAKHEPLRGYVWSEDKHTIVPAEPAIEDPPASDAPRTQTLEGSPAEEPPPPPPERTAPAPFEPEPAPAPSPVPNPSAPIIE